MSVRRLFRLWRQEVQRPWGGSVSGGSEELLRMLAGVDYGGLQGEELREIKPESPQTNFCFRTSLVVQRLGPRTPNAGDPGSAPVQGLEPTCCDQR